MIGCYQYISIWHKATITAIANIINGSGKSTTIRMILSLVRADAGNLVNGYMVSYLVLNFLWVHVPLLIVIVTGDLLAGEANAGTFRILLTRPVSRFSLVTAKYIAALVYTLVIVIFLAMLNIGLGLLIFGKGDLMVFLGGLNIFEENDILWRFAAAYTLAFLSMTTIAALSLFFSSLSNNYVFNDSFYTRHTLQPAR